MTDGDRLAVDLYHSLANVNTAVHGHITQHHIRLIVQDEDVAVVTVGLAASQGNFELNVFMPVCAYNFLQSVRLLADAISSFSKNSAVGIKANKEKMRDYLNNSLMLVTALNPYIGYENAAKVAKLAYSEGISLKEACVKLGFMSSEQFDKVFIPENMV